MRTVPGVARIALDIDSTLHHYWDLLEQIAMDEFGVAIPYADQADWGITALDKDQLVECIRQSHSDENIAGSAPYEGAVAAVNRWHAAGHWIHVTSHRREACAPATERWLSESGFRYDDLHCSFDKITRCVELDVDVLVDDSPVNLRGACEHGILGATILHPWNEQIVSEGGVVAAPAWADLEAGINQALAEP